MEEQNPSNITSQITKIIKSIKTKKNILSKFDPSIINKTKKFLKIKNIEKVEKSLIVQKINKYLKVKNECNLQNWGCKNRLEWDDDRIDELVCAMRES